MGLNGVRLYRGRFVVQNTRFRFRENSHTQTPALREPDARAENTRARNTRTENTRARYTRADLILSFNMDGGHVGGTKHRSKYRASNKLVTPHNLI